MSEYPNRTDRDEQWIAIRELLLERDVSRTKLRKAEGYFFSGDYKKYDVGFEWRMLFSPNLSVENFQNIVDSVDFDSAEWRRFDSDNAKVDFLFEMSQKAFLSLIGKYKFSDEDRAWLFTQVYGDVYSPDRLFPLRMPGEDSHRKFSFDALYILNGWMLKANMYVKGRYKEDRKEDWFLHIPGYFHSLLSFSEPVIFSLDMTGLDEEQEDFNRYLNKILSIALMDVDELKEEQKKRVLYARKVKSLFDSYKGDLGEYQLLVEKHKNNA